MGYNKKNLEILTDIWRKSSGKSLTCPKCGNNLVLIQLEPIMDALDAFTPYDTIIECSYCSFNIRVESYTILGSVKNFDLEQVEIGSWAPSGSRVLSKYEHILDYDLLKVLKESGELVEFLIVDKQVIQVIG
jgi:hypothetical protein